MYSCVVILSGQGTLTIDDLTYPIKAGMGMVITSQTKIYSLSGKMDVLVSQPPKMV